MKTFIYLDASCVSADDEIMRRLSELLKPNICIVVYSCYSDRFKTHLAKM